MEKQNAENVQFNRFRAFSDGFGLMKKQRQNQEHYEEQNPVMSDEMNDEELHYYQQEMHQKYLEERKAKFKPTPEESKWYKMYQVQY